MTEPTDAQLGHQFRELQSNAVDRFNDLHHDQQAMVAAMGESIADTIMRISLLVGTDPSEIDFIDAAALATVALRARREFSARRSRRPPG